MRWALAGLFAIHGLIHLMGFVQGFGLASIPQLTQPISRPLACLWLAAAVAMLAAAIAWIRRARWFWMIGVLALSCSQAAIASAWADAKFGSIPNAVLLLVLIEDLRRSSNRPSP